MRPSSPGLFQPLSVREQLDAMLMGWLERHAEQRAPGRVDRRATAIVTVADEIVPEVEGFCGKWGMALTRLHRGDGAWAVLEVQGPLLAVQGFTEITGMYRR